MEGDHEGVTTKGDHRAATARVCHKLPSVMAKGSCEGQSHGVTVRCNHKSMLAGWGKRWEVSPCTLCAEELVGGW
jgi:hypothetical protein